MGLIPGQGTKILHAVLLLLLLSRFSCVRLCVTLIDCSPPSSPVPGIWSGWHGQKSRCALLYLKWISNKALLYTTGNSAQCYVAVWMGGEFGRERIYVYIFDWVPLLEKIDVLLAQSENSLSPHFCSFRLSANWMMSTRLEEAHLLCSVHQFKC